MNLDKSPTSEQLRELLAQCDDRAGAHVVWVKRNGDVVISRIATGWIDVARIQNEPCVMRLQEEHPEMQMRCETFLRGNEYVGPEAVANDEWVSELFDTLVTEWRKTKGMPEIAYIRISDASRTT